MAQAKRIFTFLIIKVNRLFSFLVVTVFSNRNRKHVLHLHGTCFLLLKYHSFYSSVHVNSNFDKAEPLHNDRFQTMKMHNYSSMSPKFWVLSDVRDSVPFTWKRLHGQEVYTQLLVLLSVLLQRSDSPNSDFSRICNDLIFWWYFADNLAIPLSVGS